MKIIFLDIDGVMVTGSYLVKSTQYEGYKFNPNCVKNLKEILAKTGACIVVSSSWRKRGFQRVKQIFQSYGLSNRLIGQTPIIQYGTRGDEIKQYLKEVHPSLSVERFVILDDRDDMGDLLPHLVQTNWYRGLDEIAKERAIKMLL